MDGGTFDRLTRLLASRLTRRSALAASALSLPAVAAARQPHGGNSDSKRRGKGRGHGPRQEGPCGDGSRKANACTKDSQCCTGLCKTSRGKHNLDGKGRCRCQRRGRSCAQDRNCCGTAKCVNQICGGDRPQVETGAACNAALDVCRNPHASCGQRQHDPTAGTFCLLPNRDRCDGNGECVSSVCAGGFCQACSDPSCATPCQPVVCATCAHKTVQSAIDAASDGAIIDIGAGTWIENLTIASKSLTLRACPGERVVLQNKTSGKRTIEVTGGKKLTILNIIVDGSQDRVNGSYGGGIGTDGSLTLAGTASVRNAGWAEPGGGIRLIGTGRTLTVTDSATVQNCGTDSYGGGIYVAGASEIVIDSYARISDNVADSYGGGVAGGGDGVNLTLAGHARIENNRTNGAGGGGVAVPNWSATRPTSVTIKDDVVIAGNISLFAGAVSVYGASAEALVTVSIRDRVRVVGNANISSGAGGGVFFGDWVKTTISGNVEISGNRSYQGAGVGTRWLNGVEPAGFVATTITESVRVVDNIATLCGGGLFALGATIELTGSATVSGNTAMQGGGACLYQGPRLIVSGSGAITGNTATDPAPSGGGVWSYEPSPVTTPIVTITGNGTISGNSPDQCAGGTISC